MQKNTLSVSVIIPTLNSSRTLEKCLRSIKEQKYPLLNEIIIADGGSSDQTLQIANKYGTKLVKNFFKTGEAGKAVGAKLAKGNILAFIDSDNILVSSGWFTKMVQPFKDDNRVVASEPVFFDYHKNDHWLTRYFALLGMGDPLSLFLGNYDKYSYITKRWTSLNIDVNKCRGYFTFLLNGKIPTIGANGFLIKKEEILKYPFKDYLFDIDVLRYLADKSPIIAAKVDVGIKHIFAGDIFTFIRKQRRRARDYFYFLNSGFRVKNQNLNIIVWGVLKFLFSTVFILPVMIQAVVGYIRKPDPAWLFHIFACWITLVVYSLETIRSVFIKEEFNRRNWKQ